MFYLRLAGLSFLLGVPVVQGDTIRLTDSNQVGAYHGVEDTTIESSAPDASFGGAQTLAVGSDAKALIRFSTASLPPGTNVDRATLELTLEKIDGDWKDAELVVYPIAAGAAGWSSGKADGQPENGATCWNYLLYAETKNIQTGLAMHTPMIGQRGFAQAGADYVDAPLARVKLPPGAMNFHVSLPLADTKTVQSWVDNPAQNPGVLLVVEGLAPVAKASATFSSSETSAPNAGPALVLETQAAPSALATTGTAPGAGVIHYELKNAGLISLNVYDAQGQVVREVLHAAERSAGPHDEAWDGLDETGQKLPPGSYSWKLLETQGLQAEYLMTLGLSVDYFDLWPGNHLGITGVAVDESGVYFGSGCSEARGFVMKMAPDGKRFWSVNRNWFEEWQGPDSLAVDGNNAFIMQENYDIARISADKGTGEVIWNFVYDPRQAEGSSGQHARRWRLGENEARAGDANLRGRSRRREGEAGDELRKFRLHPLDRRDDGQEIKRSEGAGTARRSHR